MITTKQVVQLMQDKYKAEQNLEMVLNQIDFYIQHYDKLGRRGLSGVVRELQTDINNALEIGDD